MIALQEYFCMLSEYHGSNGFVLVTDNASSQKQRTSKQQSRRRSCCGSYSEKQHLKFSVVSPEDDKCPSRPRRTLDVDDGVYGKSETKSLRLQTTTTKKTRETMGKHKELNVWSLNQTHFQYSRNFAKRKEYSLKDDSSSNFDSLLPREARWKF